MFIHPGALAHMSVHVSSSIRMLCGILSRELARAKEDNIRYEVDQTRIDGVENDI